MPYSQTVWDSANRMPYEMWNIEWMLHLYGNIDKAICVRLTESSHFPVSEHHLHPVSQHILHSTMSYPMSSSSDEMLLILCQRALNILMDKICFFLSLTLTHTHAHRHAHAHAHTNSHMQFLLCPHIPAPLPHHRATPTHTHLRTHTRADIVPKLTQGFFLFQL